MNRRASLAVVACVAAGLLVYQLLPRDEARIQGLLEQLCVRVNQTRDEASLGRLRAALPSVLAPQVTLRIVELDEELAGLAQVSERAASLLAGAPLTLALNSVQVQLTPGRARVDADLLVTVSGSGEQRRDLRRTRVLLHKSDDVWRIESMEIGAVAPSEPEPRP